MERRVKYFVNLGSEMQKELEEREKEENHGKDNKQALVKI